METRFEGQIRQGGVFAGGARPALPPGLAELIVAGRSCLPVNAGGAATATTSATARGVAARQSTNAIALTFSGFGAAASSSCVNLLRLKHIVDKKNGVLAATILGSSMVFIDSTVVSVILPRLQSEFHVTGAAIQWVVDGYLLFLSALILLGGTLGDHFGRRIVFEVGIVVFVAASVGCGLSRTFWQLTLARSMQGIGGALLTPGSLAIIDASFPGAERGKAIGTWAGFTAITTAIGPVLGGWISDNLSWRWVFFINVPLALITLAMTHQFVPELRLNAAGPALDLKGAVTSTLGLGGITLGLVESARTGIQNPWIWMASLGGLVRGEIAVDHRPARRRVRISVAGLSAWNALALLDAVFSGDCTDCARDGHLCSGINHGSARGGTGHTNRHRLGSEQRCRTIGEPPGCGCHDPVCILLV